MIWQILALAACLYAALCAAVYLYQDRLLYFPVQAIAATPERIGIGFEDVWLPAADGARVHGWWVPAPGASRAVLFLHGNAGNVSDRLETVEILHRLGLAVLIIDYRGYGLSGGSPSEEGTYADALAAWRHLVGARGFAARAIVVFGRSLGGGVATWLAEREPPGALILESTFTSVPDVAARIYPYLPVRLLARTRYPSLERIRRIRCPLLVAHSPADEVIPYEHGRRLLDAANEPKSFLEMRGTHGDGFLTTGEDYVAGLRRFLDGLGTAGT